jgi:hypothetical protein
MGNKLKRMGTSHWHIRNKLKEDKRLTEYLISELGHLNDIDHNNVADALFCLAFTSDKDGCVGFNNDYYNRADFIKNIDLLKFLCSKNKNNIGMLYDSIFLSNIVTDDPKLLSLIEKLYHKVSEFDNYEYIEKLYLKCYYSEINFSEEIVLQKLKKDVNTNRNIKEIKNLGIHCSKDPKFFAERFKEEKRSEGYQQRRLGIVEKAIENFALSEDNSKLFAKGLNRGSLNSIAQIIGQHSSALNREFKTYGISIEVLKSQNKEVDPKTIDKIRELKLQADSLSLLSKNLIVYATDKSSLDFVGYLCDVLNRKDFTYCIPFFAKVNNYWATRRIKERMETLTNNK